MGSLHGKPTSYSRSCSQRELLRGHLFSRAKPSHCHAPLQLPRAAAAPRLAAPRASG
eukprot:SAG31_NODE_44840_length_261_cov_0.641975_1_plen_56_part_01